MTNPLATNIVFILAPKPENASDHARSVTPMVVCDQCKQAVTDGGAAGVYYLDSYPTVSAHPALPAVVHDRCAEAYQAARPYGWIRWGTVHQFLQQLRVCVSLDELRRRREEGTLAQESKSGRRKAKKSRTGFAA
jgi:hypothetical protein